MMRFLYFSTCFQKHMWTLPWLMLFLLSVPTGARGDKWVLELHNSRGQVVDRLYLDEEAEKCIGDYIQIEGNNYKYYVISRNKRHEYWYAAYNLTTRENERFKRLFPESFLNARCFSDGLAAVQAKNHKWGYLDQTGHYAISPQFDEVEDFYYKKNYAAAKQDGLWGYIHRDGSYLVPPTYPGRSWITPRGSLALVSTEPPKELRVSIGHDVYFGPWQRLDYSGKPVGVPIDLAFDIWTEIRFDDDWPMRVVTRAGKWGFVNESFEVVIQPRFEYVWEFSKRCGVAWVKEGGLWGLINKNGSFVVEPRDGDPVAYQYEDPYYELPLSEPKKLCWAGIRIKGKPGIYNMHIDKQGRIVRAFQSPYDQPELPK